MASKDKKTGPQSKHRRDGKDAVPRKQPKAAPPKKQENKSKDDIQKDAALSEAKARVKLLNSAADEIRARIQAERAQAVHDPSAIQAEIDLARLSWEKVQSELDQAKGLSRKRKDEIDEWKAWYEKLPLADKDAGLARLQNEIKWRAAELDGNGEKINILIPQEFETRGVFEMAQHKLTAFQMGFHKLPIEEDPRLKSVLAEMDKSIALVDQLEPRKSKQK